METRARYAPTAPARGRAAPDPTTAFEVAPGTTYLDAATFGLPPRETVQVMREALAAWAAGTADWIEEWDRPAERCRADYATLVGVPESTVALLPAVSVGVGWIAAGLTERDEVVVPSDEFTSTLFPFLVARERGVRVREVAIGDLADAVGPSTTLVATSLVQMQTGLRADLSAIREATDRVGARLLIDGTQAVPFLRPDEDLASVDYVLVHAYKHLLCPRGAAFLVIRRDRQTGVPPMAANWRAADQPYGRYFEGPLTLGRGARRFDVSLAWLSWVGAGRSLRLLCEWRGVGAFASVWDHANALAREAGLPTAVSTLVCIPVADPEGAAGALAQAGIRASVRGSAVRLSVHLWNGDADIDLAMAVLRPYLSR